MNLVWPYLKNSDDDIASLHRLRNAAIVCMCCFSHMDGIEVLYCTPHTQQNERNGNEMKERVELL